MIESSKTGRLCIFSCLTFFFFLVKCTRPEDNAIKPLNVPVEDSITIKNPQTHPEIHTIEISGMKFQPDQIIINKGDTVIWKNNDLVAHCITEINKKWTSSSIPSGGSWKVVLNTSADYFCAIHQVMSGKIIVE